MDLFEWFFSTAVSDCGSSWMPPKSAANLNSGAAAMARSC